MLTEVPLGETSVGIPLSIREARPVIVDALLLLVDIHGLPLVGHHGSHERIGLTLERSELLSAHGALVAGLLGPVEDAVEAELVRADVIKMSQGESPDAF